eukprot:TRINITY_DN3501_c0_g1_i3.p1 TRINITY_DN3501_c0_g1~~TRINITY_DN3501_c0_g1_i3.p1  ORF type:complete len:369 (-),score=126.89 TRINITY_DN3501_c0_g1_i3:624-1706(-)
MAAAELLASMFPDADANVLKAVLGASNDNVDMALTVLLEYTQALEQGAAAPSTEALEFLQGMFGDVDRAMIVAVDKLNSADTDRAVEFLLEYRGQLEALGGPSKHPSLSTLNKTERAATVEELFRHYAALTNQSAGDNTSSEAVHAVVAAAAAAASGKADASAAAPVAGAAPQIISANGLVQLLTDLKTAPDSLLALVLGWQFKTVSMGEITQVEFIQGMDSLGCATVDDLRTRLEEVADQAMKNKQQFNSLYIFAFDFCRETEASKVIDITLAAPMLQIVLGNHPDYSFHTKMFVDFLKDQKTVKAMNRDQWTCWLDFAKTVPHDLHGYDEQHPWPLLFDEFVEWRHSKTGNNDEAATN